jgi:hypothetical protein
MKIIFLDFDGVMATDYHSLIMGKNSLPEKMNLELSLTRSALSVYPR